MEGFLNELTGIQAVALAAVVLYLVVGAMLIWQKVFEKEDRNQEDKNEAGNTVFRWFVVGSLFYAVLVIAVAITFPELLSDDNGFALNALGDYFAGSFAGLAFAWFVYTATMQRKELETTRKSYEAQTKEMEQMVLHSSVKTISEEWKGFYEAVFKAKIEEVREYNKIIRDGFINCAADNKKITIAEKTLSGASVYHYFEEEQNCTIPTALVTRKIDVKETYIEGNRTIVNVMGLNPEIFIELVDESYTELVSECDAWFEGMCEIASEKLINTILNKFEEYQDFQFVREVDQCYEEFYELMLQRCIEFDAKPRGLGL